MLVSVVCDFLNVLFVVVVCCFVIGLLFSIPNNICDVKHVIQQNELLLFCKFDFKVQPNKSDNFSLFPIVFVTLQLPISLEPFNQF